MRVRETQSEMYLQDIIVNYKSSCTVAVKVNSLEGFYLKTQCGIKPLLINCETGPSIPHSTAFVSLKKGTQPIMVEKHYREKQNAKPCEARHQNIPLFVYRAEPGGPLCQVPLRRRRRLVTVTVYPQHTPRDERHEDTALDSSHKLEKSTVPSLWHMKDRARV